MNTKLHKTLERQIKKHLGSLDNVSNDMKVFIDEINNTYDNYEDDINLLQNSIEISSTELRSAFEKQKKDSENQKEIITKIKKAISAINPKKGTNLKNPDLPTDPNELFDTLLNLIDDQKKAKDLINKLSMAVEQNPASIVITNIEGKIEYVNQKFCEITGYTKKEAIGENPNILKSDLYGNDFYKNLWDTITSNKQWNGEFLNKKKNGELYWELATISAVKNSNDEVINYLAIKEDITERKKTEETLENERKLFRTIIDLIPDAVYVKDLNGRKILSNPSDIKFTNKNTEKEVIGLSDKELLPTKQADESYKEDLIVLKTGQSILNKKGYFFDRNNLEHSLLISKVPLYDIQKKIIGLVGVTHDISEIKKAELNLKKAHKSLADILNAALYSSIIAVDLNGNITVFSKGAEIMLGYSAHEIIGKKTTDIFHIESEMNARQKELSKELDEPIESIDIFVAKARKEGFEERTWTYVRKDGSTLIVNLVITSIRDTNNKITGYLGIANDITLQKQNESILLKARNEAELANKAKSEFLANVSHEIRTPMNAIIGFAEILKDQIHDEKQIEHLKTILISGRTLLSLINDILDLSKIESGKLELELEPLDILNVFNEIEQIFAPKIKQKNLAFEFIQSTFIPEFIIMDKVRLHQILFNLVGNAIKFTEKGSVRVSVEVLFKNKQTDKADFKIDIHDTGIGIPSQQIDNIFEAFTQQSGQSNRKYEGTGLGLAICKRLIEKLNGNISVVSEVGKGSTFTVFLKNIKIVDTGTNKVNKDTNELKSVNFNPATLMIVDDIDINIKVVESMLEKEGIDFIEAKSGEEAILLLETEKPNLIFMDIRMTGISGISATKIIKNEMKIKTPIVAFTASVMQDQIAEFKTIFDGVIQKPITKKVLIETLKKHLKYSYTEIQTEEVTQQAIEEEFINVSNELINEIETDIIPFYETISDSLVLFEIEEFCDKLLSLDQNYNCIIITKYAEKLKNTLQTFNVELIETKLKDFKNLFEELKKELQNKT